MEEMMTWAQGPLGWAILALIAYGDAVIVSSFFVPGELAFLAAGSVWAATGDLTLIFLVLVSAWLADQTSFWLGRRYGKRIAFYWLSSLKRRQQWRKAQSMLQRHTAKAVILSRILGPVAWIMPFMAGIAKVPTRTFVWSSAIGVVIGAGQFVLYGSLLHTGLSSFSAIVMPVVDFLLGHWVALMVLLLITLAGIVTWRWLPSKASLRLCLSISSALLLLGAINGFYFFAIGAHAVPAIEPPLQHVRSICDLKSLSYRVQPGPTELHKPQPINIALLSDQTPKDLMASLGWTRNKTYSQDEITVWDYLKSLLTKELPISELYWQGRPADSAFQLPGSISERVHIRWWQAGSVNGQGLYVASLSRDEELAIKYYKHIPALLHDIARDVDRERALFQQQVKNRMPGEHDQAIHAIGTFRLGHPVAEHVNSDYFTDGGVLLLRSSTTSATNLRTDCLSPQAQSHN